MHWRKVEVGGILYEYYIGKQNVVIRNTVTDKKVVIGLDVISGMSWTDIERAMWKKNFSVVPAKIATYIEREGI
jgi:hypothetical protein